MFDGFSAGRDGGVRRVDIRKRRGTGERGKGGSGTDCDWLCGGWESQEVGFVCIDSVEEYARLELTGWVRGVGECGGESGEQCESCEEGEGFHGG